MTVRRSPVSTTSRKILAKLSEAPHSPRSPGLAVAEFHLPFPNKDFIHCHKWQLMSHSKSHFITTLLNFVQLLQILKSEGNVWETGPVGKDTPSSFA